MDTLPYHFGKGRGFMTRRLTALLAALALVILTALPASAVVWGQPDGTRHPYAGAMVVQSTQSGAVRSWCSGTLISPTVFLTAAHCLQESLLVDYGLTFLGVTFDPAFDFDGTVPDRIYSGTIVPHPDYDLSAVGVNDIGVVVLDAPVTGITPAQLPAAGLLDSLQTKRGLQDTTFTLVGYGAWGASLRGGSLSAGPYGLRQFATVQLITVAPEVLALTNARGTGGGGCFGDSGAGVFFGPSNVVVATTVGGPNPTCLGGYAGYTRTDSAMARAFLSQFVTLPE